jgi:putative phosphoribosyl transferase
MVLAKRLSAYAGRPDVVVLALPRGGVSVAYEVASALGAPLDVILVRKLGLPGREELAIGAIASGGVRVLNEELASQLTEAREIFDLVAAKELRELQRREAEYRDQRPFPTIEAGTIILVDDGLATGSTMKAAMRALRQRNAARVVVAVPGASAQAFLEVKREADEMICVVMPEEFYAVGEWYEDFSQTTDEEVHDLLARAEKRHGQAARPGRSVIRRRASGRRGP